MELSWQLGDEGPHHAVLASLSSQCDVDEEVEVGYDKEEKNVFDAHAFAREEGRTDAIDDIEANMEGDKQYADSLLQDAWAVLRRRE